MVPTADGPAPSRQNEHIRCDRAGLFALFVLVGFCGICGSMIGNSTPTAVSNSVPFSKSTPLAAAPAKVPSNTTERVTAAKELIDKKGVTSYELDTAAAWLSMTAEDRTRVRRIAAVGEGAEKSS